MFLPDLGGEASTPLQKFFVELFFKKATSPRPQAPDELNIEEPIANFSAMWYNGIYKKGRIGLGDFLMLLDRLNGSGHLKGRDILRFAMSLRRESGSVPR